MIQLEQLTTPENFDEVEYLAGNPDVKSLIEQGKIPSGLWHFTHHGKAEQRKQRASQKIQPYKAEKLSQVQLLLDPTKSHDWIENSGGAALCFLNDDLKQKYGIFDTSNVSAHLYDANAQALIEEYKEGLILDCGAGRRSIYYENVVNYEIVNYDSTDVIGVAEELPFKDNSFDAVISIAVLEHVIDPFKAAQEIVRVLKPGGKLYCCVPFLQPLHGYPNHYYNMTHEGLRNLFKDLTIVRQEVYASTLPIWMLTWVLNSWANGLSGTTKQQFLQMQVQDLLGDPVSYLSQGFVRELSVDKNFELACATGISAVKKPHAASITPSTSLLAFSMPIAESAQTLTNTSPPANSTQSTSTQAEPLLQKQQQLERELLEAKQRIAAMETSKFWRLRSIWFKVKRSIGLPTNE